MGQGWERNEALMGLKLSEEGVFLKRSRATSFSRQRHCAGTFLVGC